METGQDADKGLGDRLAHGPDKVDHPSIATSIGLDLSSLREHAHDVLEIRSEATPECDGDVTKDRDDGRLGRSVEDRARQGGQKGLQQRVGVRRDLGLDSSSKISSDTNGGGEDLELVKSSQS